MAFSAAPAGAVIERSDTEHGSTTQEHDLRPFRYQVKVAIRVIAEQHAQLSLAQYLSLIHI